MPDIVEAKRPIFAVGAFVAPMACTALGIAMAFGGPSQAGDFPALVVWAVLAALSAIASAVASLYLREPWRPLAVIGALLGLASHSAHDAGAFPPPDLKGSPGYRPHAPCEFPANYQRSDGGRQQHKRI